MPLLDPIPSPVEHADFAALEWEPLLAFVAGFAASPVGREAILDLTSLHRRGLDPPPASAHRRIPPPPRRTGLHPPRRPLRSHPTRRQGADSRRGPRSHRVPGRRPPRQRRSRLAVAAAVASRPPRRQAPRPLRSSPPSLTTASLAVRFAESIERKIQPDGSLADNASPELGRIRREQERQQRVIEESLRAALRKLSSDGSTQEDLITIRGDRFVIPVRSELKRRVSGVVHGASSSGQTVYVEPLETIEQNNELVRLIEEEQAEIHRIFVALTRQVGGYAQCPRRRRARARSGRQPAGPRPLRPRLRLRRAGHCARSSATRSRPPSAARKAPPHHRRPTIVPLTLELTAEHRQLIISGPNTGGKTVTLKTTALLAMMAQAGLPVPAAAASFPVFTAFLADIGDAQSIEAALSTFSAHILNLDRLSRLADAHSLVLLDELGSATDPEEGSALAVAIASHFLAAGAWSLISTHHTSLKVYAANTPGVLNAAAGVDEVTLVPNYQLRLGVPGASAGIQTAERLGLNADIIAAARQRLGSQQVDIARFLDKLHNELTAT